MRVARFGERGDETPKNSKSDFHILSMFHSFFVQKSIPERLHAQIFENTNKSNENSCFLGLRRKFWPFGSIWSIPEGSKKSIFNEYKKEQKQRFVPEASHLPKEAREIGKDSTFCPRTETYRKVDLPMEGQKEEKKS